MAVEVAEEEGKWVLGDNRKVEEVEGHGGKLGFSSGCYCLCCSMRCPCLERKKVKGKKGKFSKKMDN